MMSKKKINSNKMDEDITSPMPKEQILEESPSAIPGVDDEEL